MSLDGLDVFVEVVNAQSFSVAAGRLGMPATTVSAKVKRLEDKLGTTLLRRTTRKLSLTQEGEVLYKHGVKALAEIAEARRRLAQNHDEPTGELRLTAPPDIAQSVLPPIIDRYMQIFPKVRVSLNVSNDIRDLVGDGIDLAVRIGDLADSSLIARRFFKSYLGYYAAEAYLAKFGAPETFEALSEHREIALSNIGDSAALFENVGTPAQRETQPALQVNDIQTLETYLSRGMGIGLLPEFTQNFAPHQDRLVRVLPRLKSRSVTAFFVYPRQSFVPPTVRRFIETALEFAPSKES